MLIIYCPYCESEKIKITKDYDNYMELKCEDCGAKVGIEFKEVDDEE